MHNFFMLEPTILCIRAVLWEGIHI